MKILLILALAIAVFLVIQRLRANSGDTSKKPPVKTAKTNKKKNTPGIQEHPYGATSIVIGENACEAVRALAETPFLDRDKKTPLLPLADCTTAKCTCKYAHQKDRRDIGEDRRFGPGMQSGHYATGEKENRRFKKGGRREYDD